MLSLNDKISLRQLQTLLVLDILGTGVIILPRRVAEFAGQDGWAVIAVATAIAMLYAFVITSLIRMFPGQTFLAMCTKIVTRPVAIVISLGMVAKIVVNLAMELRFFAEIVKQTMLYNTPFVAVFVALTGVSAYAAAKGYETRARMAEVLLPIVFVPLGIVFAFAIGDGDFTNLLPVLQTQPMNIVTGGFLAGMSFTGIEFCLLINPFVQEGKKVRKAVVTIVGVIGALMLVITVITIAKFGPLDVQRQMWPVLEMMDMINFPGDFIERQEALIMSFWIISVFAVVNAGLFFAAIQLKDVFVKGRHSWYIVGCIPVIYVIATLPENMADVYRVMDAMFLTCGLAYMCVIPLGLIVVAKLRGLGERYGA